MKKAAFYTLGCKLNYSESSTLARQLKEGGFEVVPFQDAPDIFVINTCSVTENANRKCRKIVRDAKRIAPKALVVIIGCYAQLKPEEIASIDGVDLVLGASEKFRLLEVLQSLKNTDQPKVMSCDINTVEEYHASYSIADRTRSFLKVQDGCDYSCSFCTIPLARGSSRSASIQHLLEQAQEIISTGSKEIVLTGVNTGDFGIIEGSRKHRFIDLLQALSELKGINRIRISSIEPNLLTEEIINLVASSKVIVPHFHIPLQSGSDTILKKMKRRYLTDLYQRRMVQIKSAIPHCCIGADVLVGFPGETDELFLETYNFIKELPISYLHVFTYSERPNTAAIHYTDPVPLQIRHQRSKLLRILSDRKRRVFYQNHLNESHTVLFEDDISEDQIFGFTRNYIRVGVPVEPDLINREVEVSLNKISSPGHVVGQVQDFQPVS
jgi:threonylcarbamoyladenosine tRNA methylthiotransferase MtaB